MPDLSPELILAAYQAGAFPMAMEHGEIGWFSPDPRGVLPLDGFQAPRSLRQTVRRGKFDVRIDTAFAEVMRGCADRTEGTWISDEIHAVYTALFEQGAAHSVECWAGAELAGGLYGVAIGGAFFGESMFTRVTDASKVALFHLVARLNERGYTLLDTQWLTPHLARFGAVEIPRREYLRRLRAALGRECRFVD